MTKCRIDIFRLEGLDCADCAAKLEKRLAAAAGVESVKINFGASKMTVAHSTRVESIIRLVNQAGYKAELENPGAQPGRQNKWWKNKKILLTFISGVFLNAGFLSSLLIAREEWTIILYLAAIISGGYYTGKNALCSVKSKSIDMNVLMSIAAIGAVAIGEWGEGATAMFLFSLGNALQALSMEKTRSSIRALMEYSPNKALTRRNGREFELPVEDIVVGDIIIVKPGERIAMDGEVVKGFSMVNQAPITGESIPVPKSPGAEVYAGTFNEEGSLEIRVTRLVRNNTLSKIISMVEEAQARRAPSQQFVDMFARFYTPVVITLALAVAIVPPLAMGLPYPTWLEKGLILLVIACPCALVISTPVSIVSAIGSAARRGILIKGGAYLEKAGSVNVVAFDKTGTLTSGNLEVMDVIPLNGHAEKDVLSIAAAIEYRSQHHLARAIIRRAELAGASPLQSCNFKAITGLGASAVINGSTHYIGALKLFEDLHVNTGDAAKMIKRLHQSGKSSVLVGTKEKIMGIIAVADQPRLNSPVVISNLRAAGIRKMIMLTGDNPETAGAIAEQLGIDDFKAELLPGDKLRIIEELQAEYGMVAMVGDGVNDAPALARADIGIAMGGTGTDTALETADIVLMSDDLAKLPYAMQLSRRTLSIIKQNITFSLLVKAIFILGTFMGITNLWMAVFADTGASLLVIANGMRLMLVKEEGISLLKAGNKKQKFCFNEI
ncbi:cadmium-translocating P-type ATPase [Desulfallas sp. Bu1-1]|jgi:Cd2+/Zn2+-exporting ATPase|uniref:heavy metal translocating P-type ATPase n=1 Tax=Desulfallas sp. Bu1-1 TaxID=2787620 RepID=UPI0018A0877F|nr:heavy metal translocating P-type ATPase [Desulfallas sp. Bu1-1]MBF7083113.1 cadmium-translocating P-type ATPase [Desulfallas sp. Bu1-1]